jgi:hypothetical protein
LERGRRLITVDTHTATEVGLASRLGDDPVFMVSPVTSFTNLRPHNHGGEAAFSPQSSTPAPHIIRAEMPSAAAANPGGRWLVVLVAAIMFIGFLIMTSLWIVVLLLMVNGTTRGWVLKTLKPLGQRIKDWASGQQG